MNDNKSIANNSLKNELELGKYLESDMISLTEDDVVGGWTPAVTLVSTYISSNTCPTTACTRAC
ncbi:class II lanthipeptide, LchA2/BrtA2 family [Bacillus nakamurai]|uniref:class II lanthipeptide, LchA2/BrtA2 family n=1 Tax=Bacillus nakamurai TaxID=1793963 RepID=UPI000A7322F6|nr:class II lanthipeptide, LchA2/BrtA2 family [Bacillus nakamurai]MED1227807.1 class II lanthipeptide, LchA2/BrtA2 family [Bacillus nakamurai]